MKYNIYRTYRNTKHSSKFYRDSCSLIIEVLLETITLESFCTLTPLRLITRETLLFAKILQWSANDFTAHCATLLNSVTLSFTS